MDIKLSISKVLTLFLVAIMSLKNRFNLVVEVGRKMGALRARQQRTVICYYLRNNVTTDLILPRAMRRPDSLISLIWRRASIPIWIYTTDGSWQYYIACMINRHNIVSILLLWINYNVIRYINTCTHHTKSTKQLERKSFLRNKWGYHKKPFN